jgi:hypothetical protein
VHSGYQLYIYSYNPLRSILWPCSYATSLPSYSHQIFLMYQSSLFIFPMKPAAPGSLLLLTSPLPSITTSSHPHTTDDLLSHLSRLGGAVSREGWTSRGSTDSSGAARPCRATAGRTRCCSCSSSTTTSGNGWRRQRRRYGRCSTAWRS